MALSSAVLANNGYQTAAEDIRNMIKAMCPYGQGVSQTTDFALSPGTGLALNYAPGYAFLNGTAASSEGGYFVWDSAGGTIPWNGPDPVNPRIDALILFVCDSQYGSASVSDGPQWTIVPGVAAGSPSPPSDSTVSSFLPGPGAWYRAANITVPANATGFVTGNISSTTYPGGSSPQMKITSGAVTASSSEQTAMSFVIPRNSLRVGSVVEFGLVASLTQTFGALNGQFFQPTVRLTNTSGTSICQGNANTTTTSSPLWAIGSAMKIAGRLVVVTTGSSGTVSGLAELKIAGFGPTNPDYSSIGDNTSVATMDTTVDQVVCMDITQGTNAHALNINGYFAYRAC